MSTDSKNKTRAELQKDFEEFRDDFVLLLDNLERKTGRSCHHLCLAMLEVPEEITESGEMLESDHSMMFASDGHEALQYGLTLLFTKNPLFRFLFITMIRDLPLDELKGMHTMLTKIIDDEKTQQS